MLKKLIEYSKNKYYTEYKVGSKASVQSNLLTEVCLDPEHYDWIGQVLSYALDDFIDAIKDKLLNVEVMNECTGKSHSWLLMSIAGLIISMIYPEEVFPLIMQHGLDENISEDAICRYLFTNKMILEKAFSMYKQNNTEIANYLVRYAPSYIIHLWKCEDVNIDSFLEADEQVNGNLLKCFAALEMETLCTDPKLQLYYEKYLAYCENYHEGKYRICDSDLGAIYLSRKSYDYLMKTNSPACTKIKNILANNLVVDCNQFDYTFYFDMDGGI